MRIIIGKRIRRTIQDPETPRSTRILLTIVLMAGPVAVAGLCLWLAWYTGSQELLTLGIFAGVIVVLGLLGLREPMPDDTAPPPPEGPEEPGD